MKERQVFIYEGAQSGWVEDLRDNASVHFVVRDSGIFWDREPTQAMIKAAIKAVRKEKLDANFRL